MSPSLEIGPILRSLRHHKGAFSLLVLEVAFGFVILVHTLIAARYYLSLHVQPTGLPEDQLVIVRRQFLRPHDVAEARATARDDLARLHRAGAGIAAAAIDTVPLPEAASFPALLSSRARGGRNHLTWPVHASPRVAEALGLTLVAGRTLDGPGGAAPADGATPALVTRTVAERLFDHATGAIGQLIDSDAFGRVRVVGVVADVAFRGSWMPHAGSLIIVPGTPVSEHEIIYVLRAPGAPRPGVVDAARRTLATASADPDTTISVAPLVARATRYMLLSEGAVIVLVWTGFLVVAVALAGSLALASFSVAERTRQIGVRRALGARRGEIVRYFLLENVVLTGFGLGIGVALAAALNQVMRRIMSELVLTPDVSLIAMAVFVATGLLSALVPARRAAAIPPWAATRTL
jgi:putative ABC transport system permease protein